MVDSGNFIPTNIKIREDWTGPGRAGPHQTGLHKHRLTVSPFVFLLFVYCLFLRLCLCLCSCFLFCFYFFIFWVCVCVCKKAFETSLGVLPSCQRVLGVVAWLVSSLVVALLLCFVECVFVLYIFRDFFRFSCRVVQSSGSFCVCVFFCSVLFSVSIPSILGADLHLAV